MLISWVAGSSSSASLPSNEPQDTSIENRRGSLQHLWRHLQREVDQAFAQKSFIKEFECGYFNVSDSSWELVICTIKNDGTLAIQDQAVKKSVETIALPSSKIIGHICKNLVQITNHNHTVLFSFSQESLGHICATLYSWSRLRPMGIEFKEFIPPPRKIEFSEQHSDLILRCELDACFTEFNPDLERWSPYCATLNRNGIFQLQVDDHSKPFYSLQLYEILSSQVVQVDPSVVGSNQVVLLFPDMGGSQSVYLKLKDVDDYEDWVAVLKALSKQPVAASFSKNSSKCVRWSNRFKIKVASCQRLQKHDNTNFQEANGYDLVNSYIEICINRWVVARTCVNYNPDVANWSQTFEIPEPDTNFTGSFSVEFKLRTGDNNKDNHHTIGSFVLSQPDFGEGWQWLNLDPTEYQLQVDCKFTRIPVLDSFFYQKLQSLMIGSNLMLPARIIDAYPSSLSGLFPLFNEAYRAQGLQINWILNLAINKVEKINLESDTLFRGSSLFIRAFEYLLQNEGRETLEKTVAKVVEALVKKTHRSLELDPSRLSNKDQLQENQRLITDCVICLWQSIKKYGPPKVSKLIFRLMKIKLISMRVDSTQVTRIMNRTLTAFLFLRFYGPALLNPQIFNMHGWVLEPHHHRTLMLIAKILQSLANRVRFGAKEMWLVPMNSVIDQYGFEVEQWYADICDISSSSNLDGLNSVEGAELLRQIENNEIIEGLERPSKQLPVSTFMGQQLSSPNLVDEPATYSQLVNVVSEQLLNKPKKPNDPIVNEFAAECQFISKQQKEILRSLEEPDLFEESAQGEPPILLLNMESRLFGLDSSDLQDDELTTKRSSISKIWSLKSRKGSDEAGNPKEKPGGSLSRFKRIIGINKT